MYAVTDAENYHIPLTCPFHRDHDMLLKVEENKKQRKVIFVCCVSLIFKKKKCKTTWRCSVCKSAFKEEASLDAHIRLKHPDKINKDATVCLADYCDILRCSDYDYTLIPTACNQQQMDKRRYECIVRSVFFVMFCSLLLICIADYHAALFPTRRE
jgi:hypothetical protein